MAGYPYYFLDPALLGATGLAANILALGSAFFGATLILLAVDHILGKAYRGGAFSKTPLREPAFDQAGMANGLEGAYIKLLNRPP